MNLVELKAVVQRSPDVAIHPATIDKKLPEWLTSRGRWNRSFCPIGLVRAKVLEFGVEWSEITTIGACGTMDYTVTHRNGVLVQVNPADVFKKWDPDRRVKNPTLPPHMELVEVKDDDGALLLLNMIVNHRAAYASWLDYELKRAQIDREEELAEDRRRRVTEPQAALMGLPVEAMFRQGWEQHFAGVDKFVPIYIQTSWRETTKYDEQGEHIKVDVERHGDTWKEPIKGPQAGVLEITLERALEILNVLTDEQKAERDHLGMSPGQFIIASVIVAVFLNAAILIVVASGSS